jgi:ATP-dependent Clp protease ATP-binding subunit ClpC
LFFIYGFAPANFSPENSRKLLGLSTIFLACYLSVRLKEAFFNSKLKKPKLKATLSEAVLNPENYNLAEFLSFEAAEAAARALRSCRSEKITSTHLLYFLLKNNPKFKFIFYRLLLSFKEIKKEARDEIKSFPVSENYFPKISKNFQDVILESLKIARKRNHLRIEAGDMLSAFAKNDPFFKKILVGNKLKAEDIENLTEWLESVEEKIKTKKRFWEYENLAKRGTLAKEWTAGYTITLDRYSNDLTESLRKKELEFVGHKKELASLERILAKTEINNVLIVGEPGTGKRSIIYALAQNSLLGKSLPGTNYKRIVELDISSLLTQIENTEEVEVVLGEIFQEAVRAGNVILLIDEFHNYVGRPSKAGIIDISGIIAPYLRLPQFQLIAITTYEGLHRYIEKDSSLLTLFEKAEVSGISKKDTLVLLEYLTFIYENKYKIFISYPALRQIIYLTERYFPSLPFPEKAIDILDAVTAYVAGATKDKIVLPKHIEKIITEKTEIPVGEIEAKEKKVLLNLENLIHQRIINQEEAVKDISIALRRARSEVSAGKGPMGAFLFLGPTGVGKTETAKALADSYFGSEDKIIRLDMSEFQAIKDIQRLIGSSEQGGILADKVRENPFSLVLLDEIEKAHPNILNLFLQVLDEGYLTDWMGRKIDFKNTIIIATGNAGYKVILEALKNKVRWSEVKQKLLDDLFEKRIFRPEFINRFDSFVVFKPLNRENLLDIAGLIMERLKKNLQKKGIELAVTESLKEKIVELSYNPVFGARQMKRVVQDKVENVLATGLLSGKLKRGQKVEIDPDGFKLIINPVK